MSNHRIREYKEGKNLFGDPRFARDAWKSVGLAILQNPATRTASQYDKDGNETVPSQIERYAYDNICRDIKEILKEDRAPSELEMILACQVRKARWDTQAAVFVRDTVGAKPVDESKLDATVRNPFEDLSDEELAIIAQHREEVAKIAEQSKENK